MMCDRQLSKEARKILDQVNNLFEAPRYDLVWTRHVDSDNNAFDAWIVFNRERNYICDSLPYDDQDCVSAAQVAFNFAREELKEVAVSRFLDWSKDESAVVVDTETTGLDGVAFEVCVRRLYDSECLLHFVCNVDNDDEWSEFAAKMHAHRMEEIKKAPNPEEFKEKLFEVLKGRRILAYNAEFDSKMIRNTFDLDFDMECASIAYSFIAGEWSEKRGGFKFVSLERACKNENIAIDATHDALSDVDLTIKLIHSIADKGLL